MVSGKYWVTDDNPCPICQANDDAGVIELDDDFPSGDPCPTANPSCECDLGGATDENA